MTKDTITILFQLAWELAKAAAYVAKHNMQPPEPKAEPLIIACTPKMPALPSPAAPARCDERSQAQLELGDRITRQMITIGNLMQAYSRCASITQLMQNDERARTEITLDIFSVTNQHKRRILLGPYSRQ
ncbi:MAG: hypothetical protein U0X20_17280 [Caldilineaceae bacterium]